MTNDTNTIKISGEVISNWEILSPEYIYKLVVESVSTETITSSRPRSLITKIWCNCYGKNGIEAKAKIAIGDFVDITGKLTFKDKEGSVGTYVCVLVEKIKKI